jgi:kynurenine formamidase
MEKKNVLVGVANKSEQSMKVDEIQDWQPEKVSYVGTTTYFKKKDGNTFYSMERSEFNDIFGHKVKR